MIKSRTYYGEYTLKHWVNLLLKKNIILPDYQRSFVWDERDLKRLIKSIKEGQFIQPVTIALYKENEYSKNLLLDGQQRLTSILLSFIGYFPNKTEFDEAEKLAFEDDSAQDSEDNTTGRNISSRKSIGWTFQELLKYGFNKEQIQKELEKDKKYNKLDIRDIIGSDNNFWEKYFIGFSYVVPVFDNSNNEVKGYFSNLFRNMNYFGRKLSNIESRKSLYYQNQEYTSFFEGKTTDGKDVLCDLKIRQDFQVNNIDFVRYLSILSQKYTGDNPLVDYSSYKSRESFYADYVSYILGLEQEQKEDKFNNFDFDESLKDFWKDRFFNLREAVLKLKDQMNLKEGAFSSWIDADYWLFGLIYYVVFMGKQIKEDITDLPQEVISKINEKKGDETYTKNSNRLRNIRARIDESINIYSNYVS
jgi:hypothetical protein